MIRLLVVCSKLCELTEKINRDHVEGGMRASENARRGTQYVQVDNIQIDQDERHQNSSEETYQRVCYKRQKHV